MVVAYICRLQGKQHSTKMQQGALYGHLTQAVAAVLACAEVVMVVNHQAAAVVPAAGGNAAAESLHCSQGSGTCPNPDQQHEQQGLCPQRRCGRLHGSS